MLQPLDLGPIYESIRKTGRLLVVQECGRDARAGRPDHFPGGAGVLCVAALCAATGGRARRAHAVRPGTGSLLPARRRSASRRPSIDSRETSSAWINRLFRMPLYLPAQGAAETEATIIEWQVAEGDRFRRGRCWRRSTAPSRCSISRRPATGWCCGCFTWKARRVPQRAGAGNRNGRRGDARLDSAGRGRQPAEVCQRGRAAAANGNGAADGVVILGVGGYLPPRVVTNAELVRNFPEISEEYVYQVTGIRQRHWAGDDERPSGMAFKAALEAIRKSDIATKDIDAIVVATTTPDVAMPSTACILQDRLCLHTVPAFDLNAACSGWLYAVAMARGMILSHMASNVLTVGVEMQSRLLDTSDRDAYFLFGDGAGAAVISAGRRAIASGSRFWGPTRAACKWPAAGSPGYIIEQRPRRSRSLDSHRRPCPVPLRHRKLRFCHPPGGRPQRLDAGRNPLGRSPPGQRPHSQSGRQAQRHRLPALLLNVENVGNTSSASIPLALVDMEDASSPTTSWSSAPSAPA